MCVKRYGKDGLNITSSQLVTCALPSIITNPAGVCIHEFNASIQKADRVVPPATNNVAMVCVRSLTRSRPNSITPSMVASKKKAVITS